MPGDQQWQKINAAFSKQSHHFDEDDSANPILPHWRQRIYLHVEKFLKTNSRILELNAGTGIDAVHFAQQGHHVFATDLSEGMISTLQKKIKQYSLQQKISTQQLSFENLNLVPGKFDFVFSNFGGLNCTNDLMKVTKHFPDLLNNDGFVTLVIMPRICPWEWLWIFKGEFKKALRRLNSRGADSHLEGHHFSTHYFSLREIKRSMPAEFEFVCSESLGYFSPPPAATNFCKAFPRCTRLLNRLDKNLSGKFPFDRWGDHLIITFRLKLTY